MPCGRKKIQSHNNTAIDIYISVYMYIYVEREREVKRERARYRCIYIYIYMCDNMANGLKDSVENWQI